MQINSFSPAKANSFKANLELQTENAFKTDLGKYSKQLEDLKNNNYEEEFEKETEFDSGNFTFIPMYKDKEGKLAYMGMYLEGNSISYRSSGAILTKGKTDCVTADTIMSAYRDCKYKNVLQRTLDSRK